MRKPILKLINVKKIYRTDSIETYALRGVNLEVYEGDFIAIMGPSGSGKTTLLNILGLLDKPTSGKVFFLGRDVSLLGDAEASKFRAKYIGFVFQQFNLIPWLTALENVEIALAIGKYPRKLRKKRAYELLEMVGLGERVHHRPRELSGGEQQRAAIARALANNPHVILADEPTGNLDSKSGAQIISILKKLSKEGKTVIVVTHNPQIAEVADRILFLRDGMLIEEKVP